MSMSTGTSREQQWLPLLLQLTDVTNAFGEATRKEPGDAGFGGVYGILAILLGITGSYVGGAPTAWTAVLDYGPPTAENEGTSYLSVTILPKTSPFIPEIPEGKPLG